MQEVEFRRMRLRIRPKLKFKANGKRFRLSLSWARIRVSDIDGLFRSGDDRDVLRVLSNLDEETIGILSADQVEALVRVVPWDLQKHEDPINVGRLEWWKMEQAIEVIQKAPRPLYAIPRLYWLYMSEDPPNNASEDQLPAVLSKKRFGQIMRQGATVLSSILDFLATFEALNKGVKPSDEEIEAGIEGLQAFGTLATLYSLSKGDVLKFEEVQNQPAETIYFVLLYEKSLNEYREKLNEIEKRNLNQKPNV